MPGTHRPEFGFGAVNNRDHVVAWTLLETIATLVIPYRFVPLVGLPTGHIFSEIHPFKTRPGACPGVQGRNIEPPLGIVSDDAIRRPEIANPSCQPPRVDPGNPD